MEMVIWWNAPTFEEGKEGNSDEIMQQAWTKQKKTFRNMASVLVGCSQFETVKFIYLFFLKGQDCQLRFYTDKLQLEKLVHTGRINIFS